MARLNRPRLNRPPSSSPAASSAPASSSARPVRRSPPAHTDGSAMGIPQWTDLLQEFPDYVQAFVERGILLYKTKRYENALYDFNKALHLDPSQAKAVYFRGLTYLACKRPREALADLKTCVSGGNAEASYSCALALTDLK